MDAALGLPAFVRVVEPQLGVGEHHAKRHARAPADLGEEVAAARRYAAVPAASQAGGFVQPPTISSSASLNVITLRNFLNSAGGSAPHSTIPARSTCADESSLIFSSQDVHIAGHS